MKNSKIGDYCIISGNSLVNKDFSNSHHCLFAGIPAKLKKENVFRDKNNDNIEY